MREAVQEWGGRGTAPNSSVKVTCIYKQCFVLGQLDSCLLTGDQDGEWEGELSDASGPCRSFALWGGMSAWPSVWRLASEVSSTRSLILATMDMKSVAVNWNSGFSHSFLGAKALARNKTNHLVWVSHILVTIVLGLHLYTTNGAPSQMWGCLQPGRKVVTYLQEPPCLAI